MPDSPVVAAPRGTPARRGKSPRSRADTPGRINPTAMPTEDAAKPTTSFTSCLSIAVEGASPIEHTDELLTAPDDSSSQPTNENKRAPRKSKTDALVALQTHSATPSSPEFSDPFSSHTVTSIYRRDGPPIPVSPTLDLNSVRTSTPRNLPPKGKPRPFGLEDCPTFHPSPEEFRDPMAYIRSVSDIAKHYGMCKIVPPDNWKMPFVTDTENFRFKTRLMRLNSIEASSRAKINFLEQLYRFHKQQGNPRVSVPTINHKPLDLWLLRKEVKKLGGYEAVTRSKKWADLGRLLGYGGIPGLSTQIKNSYTRVILPYEHYCDRVRNSPALSPTTPRDQARTQTSSQLAGRLSRLNLPATTRDDTTPPSSPLTATSSPLSEPPDDGEIPVSEDNVKVLRSSRNASQERVTPSPRKIDGSAVPPSPVVASPVFHDKKEPKGPPSSETSCEVCGKKNRGEEMLLCDGCDCGFHMFCLDPPLATIPKGQWFCHTCLFGTGGDFGFDEGEEHSLSSFQARDLEFRRMWFQSHPPPQAGIADDDPTINKYGDVKVSEYDVEEEFWRLVQSPHDTVEVEYGADVHSTTHGSAMPTLETHPLNPYSKDPWNVNNIPIVSESLLRYIKSDICGMTVPWTYVGMLFSTFCWHNEDHYTYSINYMHWGETKTWYGIPGEDAEKFEAAIKREAPDLFEAQPDLLFQLVTLMNPKRLVDAGVRVYACNQRAGDFVITYPKAYHAGFNHGLNFNEAVNFALPDWLPFGLSCVQRYREHRKLPVFSHDELLITITQQSQSIHTAIWLYESLKEMTDREITLRQQARALAYTEVLEEEDRSEDQYQCSVCKVFCYLSQVTCRCTSRVACHDHADLLCQCPITQRILRKRFSDETLVETLKKVEERAAIPDNWLAKLHKALAETARPQLRTLKTLLADGERINFHLSELQALRKCVNRGSEWIDAANTFIVRKQSRKRSRKSRGRPSMAEAGTEDPGDRPDGGLDELYDLLRQVDNLGFDCPEIATLRTLATQAEEIKAKALGILASEANVEDRDAFTRECETLMVHASSFNVHLDEMDRIGKLASRGKLIRDLEEKIDDPQTTLEEVRMLLSRARTLELPADDKYMVLLEDRQRAGDDWEERAKDLLGKPCKDISELEEFATLESTIPIDPTVLDRIRSARAKAKEYEKQARLFLFPEPGSGKPRAQDAMKLVTRVEKDFVIPAVHDLKRTAEFALDLETRSEAVLKNRYQHTDEGDLFDTMQQWKRYAREHLTMFSLPNFEKLDAQLKLHHRWLEGLPWYCSEHHQAHGKLILEDVVESTRPEDDLPPSDEYFTCICTSAVRPPPPGTVSDAVQCDHCYARFHGVCAANGGSCPFCDHHHWNGAIHKERSWHFCYLPTILLSAPDITKNYSEDWKQLEVIVHRVDRLSMVIGQFLSFASQPGNQRPEYIPQVRHYMRKLYKIQFAVSPNPEVSFGLDLAGLHRILAGQPVPVRMKKRRRPRFTFGQDVDKDWTDGTRCICRGRTQYLLNYPKVECELCAKWYHAGCVFFPVDPASPVKTRFMCPLCCLRKNRTYPYAEVRVKHIENTEPDTYVDTRDMLDSFSKDVIYMKLPPPYTNTLFVELIRFTPGQPDNVVAPNGSVRSVASSSRGSTSNGTGHTRPAATPNGPTNGSTKPLSSNQQLPPPPPWTGRYNCTTVPSEPVAGPSSARPSTPTKATVSSSRQPDLASPLGLRKRKFPEDDVVGGHTVATPPVVPAPVPELALPPSDSPLSSRKRKHVDDAQSSPNGLPLTQRSPKRRTPVPPMSPPAIPTAHRPPDRSPSLANLLSPSPNDIRPTGRLSTAAAPPPSASSSTFSNANTDHNSDTVPPPHTIRKVKLVFRDHPALPS
ncbi:hypothetical protein JAAARDRAFT_201792 [Jaapia argillacea MUCL 33604]|uniref:[histone H3]-trimethyl-L-lysine(4) demethylase n=1 Tax=Jaapia argillacea MUCL 33604 TaxID=933084 RepID=A0A067QBN7_9AGAM|nr:hypothetical protein JAAARDRAFT_201792 [Jaapia argillacea MUCL 33604]